MTWGNPPAFVPTKPKKGKLITPEQLAASGSEDGEQAALFCWSALSVGKYPQLKWLYSVPNGGSRHIVEAMKMVGTGLRAGVPDICLPFSAPMAPFESDLWYNGCYIELKIEKRRKEKNGGLADEQIEWLSYLQGAGYYCRLAYGWEEARDILIAYLEGKV